MEQAFHPGEIVLEREILSRDFFLIKRGGVKVESNGKKFFLRAGDFFGEEGCFFNKPNSFLIIASEETLIQIMSKDEAVEFLSNDCEAAFAVFIRNSAKLYEAVEPISELSPAYIRLVDGILPYVSEPKGGEARFVAGIDFPTLAERLEMSEDKLLNLFELSADLRYLKLGENREIFSCGKRELTALFRTYNQEKIFAGVASTKGLGRSLFMNAVNKKTTI